MSHEAPNPLFTFVAAAPRKRRPPVTTIEQAMDAWVRDHPTATAAEAAEAFSLPSATEWFRRRAMR